MKKVLSVLLAVTMLFTTMAAVSTEAFAAVPKTSITKLAPYKRQIKVFVKKNSKVSGYQIKYSTNKKFRSAKTKTLKGSSKTMARLMKLGHQKTYYFKVRTYKKSGKKTKYSKWSKVKKTTTNNKMDERYNKLIKEIYYAYKNHKSEDSLSKNAQSFVEGRFHDAYVSYEKDNKAANELRYMFIDLDNNGIDELILSGTVYEKNNITVSYTIVSGKVKYIVSSNSEYDNGSYGYRNQARFHGKVLYNYGSSGAAYYSETFYKLKKNTNRYVVVDKISQEYDTYFDKNRNTITEYQASAIRNKYLKTPVTANYKYAKNLFK